MKLPNGTSIEVIPDGVLIEETYKLDYESLVALIELVLTTNPLMTDDPRIKFVNAMREAIVVSNRRGSYVRLDLLRRLASYKPHRRHHGQTIS